jgi:hypothetical protein
VLSVSRGVSDREGLCVELARVVFFTLWELLERDRSIKKWG